MKKIILASNSPRRKELLYKAGFEFEVIPPVYEEIFNSKEFSYEKIENTAYNKVLSIIEQVNYNALIIGADTVVVFNNKILTKPKNRAEAVKMLKLLSNVEHHVITSICVMDTYTNQVKIKSVTTAVHFEKLTDKMISSYIDEHKPYDKAGAYGIQELPENFVKYTSGSLENVIGLCTQTVKSMLEGAL